MTVKPQVLLRRWKVREARLSRTGPGMLVSKMLAKRGLGVVCVPAHDTWSNLNVTPIWGTPD